VNKLDQQTKQPALYFAAVVEGDEISAELFKSLIRHGANIRFKDHNDQTVLFYICREGTTCAM
jgi:ankyrin repeat protein